MWNYLAVAAGGVFGCCARYGLTQLVQQVYGRNFPLATFIINVVGCFLMGGLFFLTLERLSFSPTLRTAILTGGLGGFTTFSTFAMEALLLKVQPGSPSYIQRHRCCWVWLRPLPALGSRAACEQA